MIVKEEFLRKLKQSFELNVYEVKIWTALLSKGISTAAELSDISGVPRSRAYDVLESLEKKGFVVMKLGKPIKYISVEPSEIVKRLKKQIERKSKEKVELLEKVKTTEVFDELNLLHNTNMNFVETSDLSGAIKGRDNLYNHIELMLRNAQKKVTIMTSDKGFVRKAEALKIILRKLKNSGVKVRIAAPINKDAKEIAKEVSRYAQVRNVDKITARFCVVDGKELLFMVTNDDVHSTFDTGVWVTAPLFASALENMFELSWNGFGKVK